MLPFIWFLSKFDHKICPQNYLNFSIEVPCYMLITILAYTFSFYFSLGYFWRILLQNLMFPNWLVFDTLFCPSILPSFVCPLRTPYLGNCTWSDHNFWYTCVKWWYLQAFLFFKATCFLFFGLRTFLPKI